MKRVLSGLGMWLVLGAVIGCGGDEQEQTMTKQEATESNKADWVVDYCEIYEWYGDGVCDTFCLQTDTEDCGTPGCDSLDCNPCEDYFDCGLKCPLEDGTQGWCNSTATCKPYQPTCGYL